MHGFLSKMGIIFLLLIVLSNKSYGLNVTFTPPNVRVNVSESVNVEVLFLGEKWELQKVRDSEWTTHFKPNDVLKSTLSNVVCEDTFCNSTVTVEGTFLGFGTIHLTTRPNARHGNASWKDVSPPLLVTVLRQDTILNKIFIVFVAIVVTINYINMGCALDLNVVKQVLKKPIGPIVGFICPSVLMPLVSFGLGLLLFDDPVLRLGLFTFGSSPGGGASNMWTVILGGNLHLSITMTFLSTLAALGTIPLWLFTLGVTIVRGTNIVIPFSNIFFSLISLTVPIGIGVLIQKRFPKVAVRSKKLLLPVCIIILVAIIVIACIANTYIFYMLSWRLILVACLNVWIGFAAGALISLAFRFPVADVTAVSVETGIQNTGVGFLILSYSLEPPVSDLAAVVPVAGSIITPIPLILIYCIQRFRKCCCKGQNFELQPINPKTKRSETGVDNLNLGNIED